MAMKVYKSGEKCVIEKNTDPQILIPIQFAAVRIVDATVTIYSILDATLSEFDTVANIQNQAGTNIGALEDVVKYLNSFIFIGSTSSSGSTPTSQPSGLFGLFSQTAQGATVTNTTTETDILGTGVGTLSVPANAFQVGDAYHAKIGGTISAQNGDEITIRVKNGATVLATTGLISLQAVTALAWEIEIDFTIRTIGATGQIFTNGNFAYNRNTGSLEGFVFSDLQTIDTTATSTLMITAEWNQAKTQDIIFTDMTTLYKTY